MVKVNEKYEIKKEGIEAFISVEEMEQTVNGEWIEFVRVTIIGRKFKTRIFEANQYNKLRDHLIKMEVKLGL